jgi:hypothetical protein
MVRKTGDQAAPIISSGERRNHLKTIGYWGADWYGTCQSMDSSLDVFRMVTVGVKILSYSALPACVGDLFVIESREGGRVYHSQASLTE